MFLCDSVRCRLQWDNGKTTGECSNQMAKGLRPTPGPCWRDRPSANLFCAFNLGHVWESSVGISHDLVVISASLPPADFTELPPGIFPLLSLTL